MGASSAICAFNSLLSFSLSYVRALAFVMRWVISEVSVWTRDSGAESVCRMERISEGVGM